MATYKLIENRTTTSTVAYIEFTSIPQTYTDLVIHQDTRTSSAGDGRIVGNFNGTGGMPSQLNYGFGGGTFGATNYTTTDSVITFGNGASNWTASTFGGNKLYIPNYSSSTLTKTTISYGSGENNGTDSIMGFMAANWPTTTAVNTIRLYPFTGSWLAQSTFTLYGISNA